MWRKIGKTIIVCLGSSMEQLTTSLKNAFDPIRNNPRFAAIIKKMNLENYPPSQSVTLPE